MDFRTGFYVFPVRQFLILIFNLVMSLYDRFTMNEATVACRPNF